MSNTSLRIISAVFLVLLIGTAVWLGRWTSLTIIMAAGVLCIDELLVNFVKRSRSEFIYKYVIAFFCLIFVAANTYNAEVSLGFFTFVAILLNLFLVYYLFKIPKEAQFAKNLVRSRPGLIAALVVFPLFSFGIHFNDQYWREILAMLLLVTYSMDTGAWFVGKNFGKHKLWPTVSPNKTIEGLFGGMFSAALFGCLAWYYFFGEFRWYYSVIFALCGLISQVGDLVQSKLKREFEIKDSSNLIPGHGGVYDRIDSLIFLSPFFVIVVKYLELHLSR